ncbi:MAG: DNA polymerase III subunit delta' [Methylobacteriaceae bacterium]|nr:DNA polymerase III subunit delta' [Methylobacteriaceae bacterium]
MRAQSDAVPESDRLGDMPHPRETTALFGHGAAESLLLEGYRSGRLPHTWILAGREGIGKATLAWRFARFILAHPDPSEPSRTGARDLFVPPDHLAARRIASLSHPDVVLLRREWNDGRKRHFTEIRVDDVRRAAHLFHHASAAEGYRVGILDSADDLNRNASNALLKLIEEPPPRSLFLLIAHRPGRIIPTIRSRCRMLTLQPLVAEEVAEAVKATGAGGEASPDAVRGAAVRAGGSVRAALQLLDGEAMQFKERIAAMLTRLPEIEWKEVHRLAEAVAQRDAANEYSAVMTSIMDWLDDTVRNRAGQGARRLAPYAEVWEKLDAATREVEALNLDKRPLILSLFADLATATRASRG